MAKTKRQYILATALLSGAAAILSFVALGTQNWVSSKVVDLPTEGSSTIDDYGSMKFGLFNGNFHQSRILLGGGDIPLSMVCRFDLNVCALLCGDNMKDNLEKLYNGKEDDQTDTDRSQCEFQTSRRLTQKRNIRAAYDPKDTSVTDRIFINSGVWLCTILFLIISATMGLFSSALAVWNTAASPHQIYFSIFGLYIYNAISFFSLLLSIILWGIMFATDLTTNIPFYKTLLEDLSTENNAQLGYSYWILLVSLFFYVASICLLYLRQYLISKEPEVNVEIDDNANPVIYLY